jgi:hypothetical protein
MEAVAVPVTATVASRNEASRCETRCSVLREGNARPVLATA